jgi:hypothetical protein
MSVKFLVNNRCLRNITFFPKPPLLRLAMSFREIPSVLQGHLKRHLYANCLVIAFLLCSGAQASQFLPPVDYLLLSFSLDWDPHLAKFLAEPGWGGHLAVWPENKFSAFTYTPWTLAKPGLGQNNGVNS